MFREPQLARPIWIPVQGQERLQNHLEPRIIARPKKEDKKSPKPPVPSMSSLVNVYVQG